MDLIVRSTAVPGLGIRFAQPADAGLVLDFIRKLAEYEKRLAEVTATQAAVSQTLFGEKPCAEVLILEVDGKSVGFALFFQNYSTFLAAPGIYLEDVYVEPEYRSRGIGKSVFIFLARLALERGCGRFEWSVLTWNEPAIRFYEKLGSKPKTEWTIYQQSGKALQSLAAQEF